MGVVKGWEGRFYEDFEIGDVYRSRMGRTISEVDNTWFTNLTMNTNQSHFNAPFAEASPFDGGPSDIGLLGDRGQSGHAGADVACEVAHRSADAATEIEDIHAWLDPQFCNQCGTAFPHGIGYAGKISFLP